MTMMTVMKMMMMTMMTMMLIMMTMMINNSTWLVHSSPPTWHSCLHGESPEDGLPEKSFVKFNLFLNYMKYFMNCEYLMNYCIYCLIFKFFLHSESPGGSAETINCNNFRFCKKNQKSFFYFAVISRLQADHRDTEFGELLP